MNNLHPVFKTIIENIFSPAAIAANAAEVAEIEHHVELTQAQRTLQGGRFGGHCFFPVSGFCGVCSSNLVEKISEEKMRTEVITGCPVCHSSFVE